MQYDIRVLSVRQPWAWAIIHAGKDIENRNWRSHYHGPLAIHAGKRIAREDVKRVCKLTGLKKLPDAAYVTGAIIGVVAMVDCVKKSRSNWFVGEYGFLLRHATPCPQTLPMLGRLKIFQKRVSDRGLIKVYKSVEKLA